MTDSREQLKERQEAFPELFDQLTGIQKACEGVYSEATCNKLFSNQQVLPQDPVELHRIGLRIHGRLEDPDYGIPGEPRLPGWELSDRIRLATGLKRSVDRLGQALARISRPDFPSSVASGDRAGGPTHCRPHSSEIRSNGAQNTGASSRRECRRFNGALCHGLLHSGGHEHAPSSREPPHVCPVLRHRV